MGDKEYLQLAIEEARKSAENGGFPAGAIVVKNGEIIVALPTVFFSSELGENF